MPIDTFNYRTGRDTITALGGVYPVKERNVINPALTLYEECHTVF